MTEEPLDPNDIESVRRLLNKLESEQQASVHGSGANAQNSSIAIGARGVHVAGDAGNIFTGQIIRIGADYRASGPSWQSTEMLARTITAYLRWLRERTSMIELRGIERASGAKVIVLPLETAYVSLFPRPQRDRVAVTDHNLSIVPLVSTSNASSVEGTATQPRRAGSHELLQLEDRLVITGGAGSGKTTALLHVAWTLAQALLTTDNLPETSEFDTDDHRVLPLPFFVSLGAFSRYRRGLTLSTAAHEKTLAHFISYHLISKQVDFELPNDFFARLSKEGRRVILLLDGMDEVAGENERGEIREAIQDLIAGRPELRVIVTCRTITYGQSRTALPGFRVVEIPPLQSQQIASIAIQAYECIYPTDRPLARSRAQDLLTSIEQLELVRQTRLGKDVPRLITSPLMMRLLLIVHMDDRRLPHDRANLFDKALTALLQVDYGRDEGDIRELSTDWRTFREISEYLAFHMHSKGALLGREIDEYTLRGILRKEDSFIPYVDMFVGNARERGGVLEERDGSFSFVHLAMQEFLVARYLCEIVGTKGYTAILQEALPKVTDSWWWEPLLLMINYMTLRAQRPAHDFIESIGGAGATWHERLACAELAANAALEWRGSGDELNRRCRERLANLLAAPVAFESTPATRARAADLVSRSGDARFNMQRHGFPVDQHMGFVNVPADPEFKVGVSSARVAAIEEQLGVRISPAEINDTVTPTEAFWIARFPVTVAQFREFEKLTGRLSTESEFSQDLPSRPMRWVTYRDCLEFCAWLNQQFTSNDLFSRSIIALLVREQGWRVSLPSELEWEKAARGRGAGTAIRASADGSHEFNCESAHIADTSTVGCFPPNDFGLYDMLGNVWEWTDGVWGTSPIAPARSHSVPTGDVETTTTPEDDEIRQVVKGGSWSDRAVFCRAEYRGQRLPDHRSANLGFRLALRRPSDSARPADNRSSKRGPERPAQRRAAKTNQSVARIPTTEISCVAYRVISARFPPINLFEQIASPEDWDTRYWLESLTNPRLKDEVGEVELVPREDWVFGPGSSITMAPFTHLSPVGARFSDGTFGAFYAALSLETALASPRFHRELFLRATRQPPLELDMRAYQVHIGALLHDLRPVGVVDDAVYDPDSYVASQTLARKLRAAGSEGVVYRSVRHKEGVCFAIYKPRLISDVRHHAHFRFVWDGSAITQVYQLREIDSG